MKKLRLLVAYSAQTMAAQTIIEYVTMLKNMGGFDVSFVHVTHDAIMDFDLNDFDVIFHNYCARLCFEGYVSSDYLEKLKKFSGLKVISVQDDGDRTSTLHRAIRECGFHVLITAVPEDTLNYGYPAEQLPNVEIFKAYTGYVPENFSEIQKYILPLKDRPILLGYRGRDIGARYGKLGFYKFEIGRRMQEICEARGLKHDISMREEDRIYGMDWYAFTGRCRAVLGTESGSNVWDFDGSIERRLQELNSKLGRPATYEEFLPFIEDVEKHSNIGEISPRHFEAAVLKTPMVLFRGRYSDILEPWIHYIPLEKDFSNVDDVFHALEDFDLLEKITARTYQDLVTSGQYTYKAFGEKLAAMIRRKHDQLASSQSPASTRLDVIRDHGNDKSRHERPTSTPQHQDTFLLRYNRKAIRTMGLELSNVYDFYKSQALIFQKQTSEAEGWAESRVVQIASICQKHFEWGTSWEKSSLLDPRRLKPLAAQLAERAINHEPECQEYISRAQQIPGAELSHVVDLDCQIVREHLKSEELLKEQLYKFMDVIQADLAQLVQKVSYPYSQLSTILEFVPLRRQLLDLANGKQLAHLDNIICQHVKTFIDIHYDESFIERQVKSPSDLQQLSDNLYRDLQIWRCRVWSLERRMLCDRICQFEAAIKTGTAHSAVRWILMNPRRQDKANLLRTTNELLKKLQAGRERITQSRLPEAESAFAAGNWTLLEEISTDESNRTENARELAHLLSLAVLEIRFFPLWMRPVKVLRRRLAPAYHALRAKRLLDA